MIFRKCSFLTSFLLFIVVAFSQRNQPPVTPDGGLNQPSAARSTGPRPYSEIITGKAKTDRGLLTTHRVDDKYYFEIPDQFSAVKF